MAFDPKISLRLRAWLDFLMDKYRHQCPDARSFARYIGVTPASISQVLSGKRGVGMGLLVALHRTLHISADVMLDTDPPPAGTPERRDNLRRTRI